MALASAEPEKAQAVYRTIVDAFARNAGEGHLFDSMANDNVRTAYLLGKKTWNEYHHLMGFVRFEEIAGNILYARIGPKANVLSFLMPHFTDRFPMENFMIYDEKRDVLGLHAAGKTWYLMQETGDPRKREEFQLSDKEEEYQALFRFFCRKIMIEERKNPNLQRNLLPIRFREYMTEFGALS